MLVVAMKCIEQDILKETTNGIIESRISEATYDMAYYVDDTISTQKEVK